MSPSFPINLMRKCSIAAGWSICVSSLMNPCIGNSLHGDAFNDFVERKLAIRQEKLIKSNSLSIEVTPEIANLFSSSQMVSSKNYLMSNLLYIARKGRSHFLLNKDKRLQRQAQIEIEKEEMSSQIYQLKKQVKGLKNELLIAESEKLEAENNKDILAELYDKKIIDDKGKPI